MNTMNTIEIQGMSYVSARELERAYSLTRKRAWQLLNKSDLRYVKLLQAHFFIVNEVTEYLDQQLKVKK